MTPYKFNYSTIMASRIVSFLAGSTRSFAYLTVQITCLPTDRTSILGNKNEPKESFFYGPKDFNDSVYISHPLYIFFYSFNNMPSGTSCAPQFEQYATLSHPFPLRARSSTSVGLPTVYGPTLPAALYSTSTTFLFMGPQYQQAVLQSAHPSSAHSLNKMLYVNNPLPL